MKLRKSVLKRIGIAILAAAIVGAAAAGVSLAAGGVTILTPPIAVTEVFVDVNADGIHQPSESLGVLPIYDGNQPIEFSWDAYPFPAGVTGSYRVALWQNTTPFGAPTWVELRPSHHWASNPNGTRFVMGPFSRQEACTTCPSLFVVQPETVTQYFDAVTGTYEYAYTPIAAAYAADLTSPASLEESGTFVLDIFYVAPPEDEDGSCHEGLSCAEACSGPEACIDACMSTPGCDIEEACDSFEACMEFCIEEGFSGGGSGGSCEGGGCRSAWEAYCELVTENEEDYLECLSFYEYAVEMGFCEECADDPESCAAP